MSVRKGHIDAVDRMTCEFTHGSKSDPTSSFSGERIKEYNHPQLIQSRLKFNSTPKDEWIEIKEILRKRFSEFCNTQKLERPKIEVYNKLTGKKYDTSEVNKKQYRNNMILDLPF